MKSLINIPARKLLSTIVMIIASYCVAFTQPTVTDKLILTKEQNEAWLSDLEKAPMPQQLDMIRYRILLDTNVYIPRSYADRIMVDHDKLRGARVEGCCKPALIISGHFIDMNNKTKAKAVKQLTQYINENKIDTISILTDAKAAALYGSRAAYGVIIMTTKKKKTLRRILTIDMGN